MRTKIDSAVEIIQEALSGAKRPVVYFSAGKDSTVLLHLVRLVMKLEVDAVFHKEPFLTHKYIFGERVLRQWGVVAFDWPPIGTGMWQGKDIVAYTNYYQIGTQADGMPATLALPKNIVEDINEEWVCGRERFLFRPKGGFDYPWDLAFIGHKDTDEDQIAGRVNLHVSQTQTEGGPMLAFPLRYWTDADIWDYTEEFRLPVDANRYDVATRREFKNKQSNSDYFNACINCIDRRKSGKVFCPKLGTEIDSIAEQVPYESIELEYFGEKAT